MKLRSTLPKQELNGLNAIHGDAVGHVGKTYLVVGLVRVKESTTLEDKTREAKFGLERLEVVPADSSPFIADLLEQVFEDRTGKTPLDLDIAGVGDLRKQFKPARGTRPEPTLSREPGAIEAPVRVDPSVLAPDEIDDDVIDAEVVDEADENAAEDADTAAANAVDVSGRSLTDEERAEVLTVLGLPSDTGPQEFAHAMVDAAAAAGLELEGWVNEILNGE